MHKVKTVMDPRVEAGEIWVEAKVRELSRQRRIAAQTMTWEIINAPSIEEGMALELTVRAGEALRGIPFFDVELQEVARDTAIQELLIERLLQFVGVDTIA